MQPGGAVPEKTERLVRQFAFLLGHGARRGESVDRGESDLLLLRVFARCFAERFGRFLHVQDVVHNLKSQADVLPVAGERGVLALVGAGIEGPDAQAAAQERAGFGAVDGFE